MTALLKDRLQEAMKSAMRDQDKQRLAAIRFIQAAIKQIEVDERIQVDDQRVVSILSKLVKQQQESIVQYKAGNRQDLVDKEEFELKVIQEFLPNPLSEQEIEDLIQKAMTSTGATSIQDMGKVMGVLKPQIQGRVDLGTVGNKIKALLSQ